MDWCTRVMSTTLSTSSSLRRRTASMRSCMWSESAVKAGAVCRSLRTLATASSNSVSRFFPAGAAAGFFFLLLMLPESLVMPCDRGVAPCFLKEVRSSAGRPRLAGAALVAPISSDALLAKIHEAAPTKKSDLERAFGFCIVGSQLPISSSEPLSRTPEGSSTADAWKRDLDKAFISCLPSSPSWPCNRLTSRRRMTPRLDWSKMRNKLAMNLALSSTVAAVPDCGCTAGDVVVTAMSSPARSPPNVVKRR
mmetsp:Transcript_15968/g.48786  ORF Transcript_15968/g.48786 Transcript_15968/m.48786 type:complete len:251 (+) Transcript_15968:3602-4354(+)